MDHIGLRRIALKLSEDIAPVYDALMETAKGLPHNERQVFRRAADALHTAMISPLEDIHRLEDAVCQPPSRET